MRRAISPLPQYVFTAWCLVKHRDNFTFYICEWKTPLGRYSYRREGDIEVDLKEIMFQDIRRMYLA